MEPVKYKIEKFSDTDNTYVIIIDEQSYNEEGHTKLNSIIIDQKAYNDIVNGQKIGVSIRGTIGIAPRYIIEQEYTDQLGIVNIIPKFLSWSLVSEQHLVDKNCRLGNTDNKIESVSQRVSRKNMNRPYTNQKIQQSLLWDKIEDQMKLRANMTGKSIEQVKQECKQKQQFMKRYYEQHKCCPKCNSSECGQTLMCSEYNINNLQTYEDNNTCTCYNCGDRHKRHERVPKQIDLTSRVIGMNTCHCGQPKSCSEFACSNCMPVFEDYIWESISHSDKHVLIQELQGYGQEL